MKVIDHLNKAKHTLFSFELLPPPKGSHVTQIINIVEQLKPLDPPWINVTSHASSLVYIENDNGQIIKKIHKKRPGTLGICGVIQNKFNIDAVAHILCQGFSREETEDLLIELNYMGIENVLALKGDNLNYNKNITKQKTVNYHANELVTQIHAMSQGNFLDNTEYTAMEFCIGVAGYPEKHFEAPNIEIDIANLKQKVAAGAKYIITQMFFDNQKYHSFVAMCRKSGITVPIIPGIKMLKSLSQIQNLPKLFNIEIPNDLTKEAQANPDHVAQICYNWTKSQITDLLKHNVPCIHFYLMNDATNIVNLLKSF